jgi:hypothetical protein
MDVFFNNCKSIASEIIFQKTIEHKQGILKAALDILNKHYKKNAAYNQIFNFLDFDTFAQIKELYSSNTYEFIPTWDDYFTSHKIVRHCIKTSPDPIRLIFTKVKTAKSQRDNNLRSPYWINLDDIDYAGYYKLMKFLILKHYTTEDRINASKFSKFGQKAAIETNAAYITIGGVRIKSIEQCITQIDEEALTYLIETLEIKPTWHQLNKIEKVFPPDLVEMITYYFE